MKSKQKLFKFEVIGNIFGKCYECGHQFTDGDEVLLSSVLCKVVDGKLVINDIEPEIICFPTNSDDHYDDQVRPMTRLGR